MTSHSHSSNAPDLSSDTPDIPVGMPDKPFLNTISDTNPFRDQMPSASMHREGFGKAGKPAKIQVNSHLVKSWPERPVYQYDVSHSVCPARGILLTCHAKVLIGSGAEKRGLIKNLWESKAIKAAIGKGFIFDGNKIGW